MDHFLFSVIGIVEIFFADYLFKETHKVRDFLFDYNNAYLRRGIGSGLPGYFSDIGKVAVRGRLEGSSNYYIFYVAYE